MSAPFLQSESWLGLVEAGHSGSPPMVALGSLTPSDVDDLLVVFESGMAREEFAAFVCLRALLRRANEFSQPMLSPSQRQRCLASVDQKARAFVRRERGASESLAVVVTVIWCAESPDAAFAALSAADVAGAPDPLRHTLVSLMAYAARHSPPVRAVLDALSQRPDLAGPVQEALEQAGMVSEARLASWSRQWIEKRDSRALLLLYHRYVENNGSSLTTSDIRRLFGEGPAEGHSDLTLDTTDAHVYLEFNADGQLTGWHAG